MNKTTNLTPYIIRFTVMYTGLLIGTGVIFTMMQIDSSAGSFASLIGAVIYAVAKFVEDHERIPDSKERLRLAFASLVSSLLVSLVLFGALLYLFGGLEYVVDMLSKLSVGTIVMIFAFVIGLYFAVLWFFYEWFAKMQLKALQRKKEKQ